MFHAKSYILILHRIPRSLIWINENPSENFLEQEQFSHGISVFGCAENMKYSLVMGFIGDRSRVFVCGRLLGAQGTGK